MSEFDDAIAQTPLGQGRYAGEIGTGWRIGNGVNGGFLLAFVANALRLELAPTGHPDPFTMSAVYLAAPETGPTTVEVTVLRRGGSLSVARATLRQGEDSRMEVLAVFGDLDTLGGEVATTARPPELTPIEACIPSTLGPPGGLGNAELLNRLDLRLDPTTLGWALGQPSGVGAIQAWFALADHRDPDPLQLLLAVDVLPPVSFDLGRPGWAPTIELTAHVRARPAPGPLRVRQATRNVAGGQFEEDCEVWDSAGRLVAQSRQLARLPRPSAS